MQGDSYTAEVNARREERSRKVEELDPTYWSKDKTGLLAKVLVKNNECIINDISRNGLNIVSIEKTEIGDHIIVPLKFQSYSPIKVRCRVRHSTPIPKRGFIQDLEIDGEPCPEMYMVGLALEGNNENIHAQINTLYENLMK